MMNEDDISIVQRDIGGALTILRSNGFVHGDIRDANIVIADNREYLIDFDSAGKVGVARYPDTLNDDLWWPEEDVDDLVGAEILISDDIRRLERTIGELRGLHINEKRRSKRHRPDNNDEVERASKRSRSDDRSEHLSRTVTNPGPTVKLLWNYLWV